MDFIKLGEALASIADCINLPPHFNDKATDIGAISQAAADEFWQSNNPKIEWSRKFGYAAFTLNKALHDSDAPPQWMAFDKGKRFAVRADGVKQEGIELLTHATGWGNRELENCTTHFRNAITQGDDALAMPVSRGVNDGQAPAGKLIRLQTIGFDRAELVAFLDGNGIDHNLSPQATTASPPPVVAESPEQRQDRRLKACIDAGLPMNEKRTLSRLPDGVGSVADGASVSRQAFSTDVKAALVRRESAKREGTKVHHA